MAGPVDFSRMPDEVADFFNLNTTMSLISEHYEWEHVSRISYRESAYYNFI